MSGRRFVEFVFSSESLGVDEMAERLQPVVENIEERQGVSIGVVASELDVSASVEDHLKALHRRLAPLRDLAPGARDGLTGLLRIVQYLPASEWQGHGFVVDREWMSVLNLFDAAIDVDQYIEGEAGSAATA